MKKQLKLLCFLIISFLVMTPFSSLYKANAVTLTIDDFEKYSVGQNLSSKFSLWTSSNATADFSIVEGGWGNNTKSAKLTTTDTLDTGWMTFFYTTDNDKRDWSGADGVSFNFKSVDNKSLSMYFAIVDKQNENWSAGQSIKYFLKHTGSDIYETKQGSAGGIIFPANFDGEVIIPFNSFYIPDWATPVNGILDLDVVSAMNIGFSPVNMKGQSMYIDDIKLYNADSAISSLELFSQEKVYIPTKLTEYAQVIPHAYNSLGIEVDNPQINWSITPSDSNIILSDGVVTVKPGAISGDYVVKGTLESDSSIFCEKTITITSDMSDLTSSIYDRIENRGLPSLHMAWNDIDDGSVPRNSYENIGKHDLVWNGAYFYRLEWQKVNGYEGLSSTINPSSITTALNRRASMLQANPNLIMLYSLEWIEMSLNYLPADSPWWLLNSDGQKIKGWGEGGYQAYLMDVNNRSYREMIAAKAKALVETGVLDGIFIDCWKEDPAYIDLIKLVREAIGEDMLLMVNPNMFEVPQTAPYINGLFMESYLSTTEADWQQITNTLTWAEKNLRSPQVVCLEVWADTLRSNPAEMHKMRATTALSMTRSDGFCLFADQNSLPVGDHLHNFYDFWNKSLGKATAEGFERADLAWQREFDNGTAVYNPIGNSAVTITFPDERRSVTTGKISKTHTLATYDGDIFLPYTGSTLGDINGDVKVTTVDALMILQAASGRKVITDNQILAADINKDGEVTAVDALKVLQFASGRITKFD